MTTWHNDWHGDWHNDWHGIAGDGAVPGYGNEGAATFVLDLEDGFTIKHSWVTDVIKMRAGNEQRISRNDTDREGYSGAAYLSTPLAVSVRAKLARFAAAGSSFLLGLPHEALTLAGPASTTSLPVHAASLALTDWAKPGQRVVIVSRFNGERAYVEAVIQSVSTDEIEIDVAPGWIGHEGAEIMPCRSILLEPQQNFARYRTALESWQIEARAATPLDYAPTLATLELAAFTVSPGLADAIVTSRLFGLQGNQLSFGMDNDGTGTGTLVEGETESVFHFESGVTTIGDLVSALESSAFVVMKGDWDTGELLTSSDAFTSRSLSGAEDSGDVGTGAGLSVYGDENWLRLVWDRRISNESTNTDGVHAMTTIIDHGGIPYALGTADQADWFRAVVLTAGDREDWQWFKRFMSIVRGRQLSFWLPTWREDLEYVSHAGTSLTIDSDTGDLTAWWPSLREYIQVEYSDGSVAYNKITAAVNNGDGTRTLTLLDALPAGTVTMISWLELCRFENADQFSTSHSVAGFDVSLVARVIRQDDTEWDGVLDMPLNGEL